MEVVSPFHSHPKERETTPSANRSSPSKNVSSVSSSSPQRIRSAQGSAKFALPGINNNNNNNVTALVPSESKRNQATIGIALHSNADSGLVLSKTKQSIMDNIRQLLEQTHKVHDQVYDELSAIQRAEQITFEKSTSSLQETATLQQQLKEAVELAKKRFEQVTKTQAEFDRVNSDLLLQQTLIQKEKSALVIEQESHAATMETSKKTIQGLTTQVHKLTKTISESTQVKDEQHKQEVQALRSKHLKELKELVGANRDQIAQEKQQTLAELTQLKQQVADLTKQLKGKTETQTTFSDLKNKLVLAEQSLASADSRTGEAILDLEKKIEDLTKKNSKLKFEKAALESTATEKEKVRKANQEELSKNMQEQAQEFMALLERVTELEGELRRPKTAKAKKPDTPSMSAEEARMQALVKQNRYEKKRLQQRGVGVTR